MKIHLFLSLLTVSSMAFAELDFNQQRVFELNDVSPELCSEERNLYPKGAVGYYSCDRARKVLYSQLADLSNVASGKKGEDKVINVLGPNKVEAGVNVLTSYIVEPPLQNKPEPGFSGNRGIDWSSADALVRSAARNLLAPVRDYQGNEVRYADGMAVPNHGISHAFIELKCEGLKPILTGMTTGDDLESPKNFFLHNLGLGILFRTQIGRMNTYEELRKEVDIRKQKAGDLVYVDYKLSPENCRYVYYSIKEMVAEGIQQRYGSLTDRLMNGTGMGCAMFDVGVKQMAGVIDLYAESKGSFEAKDFAANNQCKFYENWNRTIYVPKTYLPSYDNGSELLSGAQVGMMSLLLSGDDAEAFVHWISYIMDTVFEAGIDSLDLSPEAREQALVLQKGVNTTIKFLSRRPETLQRGVQLSLNSRQFLNETLQIKPEGFPFDDKPNDKNEALSFWDPQLFADWVRQVHDELLGKVNAYNVSCYQVKERWYKPVIDGYAIGLEVDMTNVDPHEQSIFLKYDKLRSFTGEKVDPFVRYDGKTNALPKLFKKSLSALGSSN